MDEVSRMAWAHDKSRHARGYGREWVRTRDAIMQRDSYLCQPCLAKGRPTPATQVDHIKPKAIGGTDEAENLQAICDVCHDAKTAADNGRKPKRMIGADGWPAA